MFCPRCGTENEPGDRFCANCGASLRAPKKEPREELSFGQRVSRLAGTSRRARLLTAGTALAILIAIVALVALPGNDSGTPPRDSFTVAADRICVKAKKQIGAVSSRGLLAAQNGDPGAYASSLVPIVAQWRVDFNALDRPRDRLELAYNLDQALLDVEIQAAGLALAAQRGAPDLVSRARHVDQLTRGVESAIRDLGLTDCSRITIAPGAAPQS